jgi:two-component system cell cycle sensor histidine kinase PleC
MAMVLGSVRMLKAFRNIAPDELSASRARLRLLNETLLVQGASAFPWPLIVALIFLLDAQLGPITHWRIYAWLGALWMWAVVALGFQQRLRHPIVTDHDERRALYTFGFIYLLNGLLWGLFVDVMWVDGNALNNTLIIVVILGLSVGFVFQLTAHFGILLCAMLPPLVTELVRMLTSHSAYLTPYLVLDPVFTLWLVMLSYQLNGQVSETLKTSILNRSLVVDLSLARDNALRQQKLADDASRAKSRFVASMSHELRTPLNAIIGFSEIIARQVYGAHALAKYTEYAGDIERSGRHLLALINQILDLAKIEAGKLELERSPVRISDVIEECRHLLEIEAQEKGLRFTFRDEARGLCLDADATALRQIILNILGNAIKFTERGGVEITVAVTSGDAEIRVTDTGPGIPSADLSRIFDPFEQVDNTLSRAKGGSGLGLAIVRKLVEGHGGTCAVESRIGHGTTFTLRLPMTARETVAA